MHHSNIAFLEVPLSVLMLNNVIDSKINDLNITSKNDILFYIPESKPLKRIRLKYFKSSAYKTYKKRNIVWLLRSIFQSYQHKVNNTFICDIGILNKLLIILVRSKNIYILDDGLASVMRKKFMCKFILFLAKFFSKKKIFYISMFNKSFSFQEGAFNINFRSSVVKNTYSNKCFYICSGPTLDGMKLEDENNLIKKIISFSSENKKELIILPHRRDLNKNKKDYIFWDYIPNNYKTFEEFYTENKFDDCFFITMYSSAICSVNHEEKKYILKDFFTPKIPSDNFFLRIFGAKVDVNTVIKYMEDNLKNITILLPKDI